MIDDGRLDGAFVGGNEARIPHEVVVVNNVGIVAQPVEIVDRNIYAVARRTLDLDRGRRWRLRGRSSGRQEFDRTAQAHQFVALCTERSRLTLQRREIGPADGLYRFAIPGSHAELVGLDAALKRYLHLLSNGVHHDRRRRGNHGCSRRLRFWHHRGACDRCKPVDRLGSDQLQTKRAQHLVSGIFSGCDQSHCPSRSPCLSTTLLSQVSGDLSNARTCRENAPQERDNALPFLRNETDRGPQLLGRRLTFPLQSPPGAVKRDG